MSRPSSNGVDGGPHGVCFARFPAEAELLSEAERIVEQLGTYSTGQQVLLYLEAHGLNPRTERWCRRTLLAHHIQPFLNAEGQDHLKAGRRLVTTHRWRKDNQVEELVCEACCKVVQCAGGSACLAEFLRYVAAMADPVGIVVT
eukprot:scaffold1481_cov401-Prasinococcus_capsulatus_cf.AAC.8